MVKFECFPTRTVALISHLLLVWFNIDLFALLKASKPALTNSQRHNICLLLTKTSSDHENGKQKSIPFNNGSIPNECSLGVWRHFPTSPLFIFLAYWTSLALFYCISNQNALNSSSIGPPFLSQDCLFAFSTGNEPWGSCSRVSVHTCPDEVNYPRTWTPNSSGVKWPRLVDSKLASLETLQPAQPTRQVID